jgi:hypothetical protein
VISSAWQASFKSKKRSEVLLAESLLRWDECSLAAIVIVVDAQVLVEVHKKLRVAQRAAKKKRRMEAIAAADGQAKSTVENGSRDDTEEAADQTSLSMEEYFDLYEQSADSYRSTFPPLLTWPNARMAYACSRTMFFLRGYAGLFCRRCFVYDCDYHGCLEQPKLVRRVADFLFTKHWLSLRRRFFLG